MVTVWSRTMSAESQTGFQIKGGLQTSHARRRRELVIVSKPENDCEEIFAIFIEPVLVGIKNAWGERPWRRRGQFAREAQLDLFGIDPGVAVHRDGNNRSRRPARNLSFEATGTPAVGNALAGEREVNPEINSGMRLGVVGDFRNHGQGTMRLRNCEASVESLDRCGVHDMRNANIVAWTWKLRIAG